MASARYSNIEITEATAMKLKDMFLLIMQGKHKSTSGPDEAARLNKLNDMIQLYQQCQQRYSDYHKDSQLHISGVSDFVPRFVQLVRECILTHEWTSVLKIVNALVNEGSKATDTLWKAGLTSLIMEKKPALVDQFVRQLYKLASLSCVEVLLDYLLYLLMHGNLERAKDLKVDYKKYYVYRTKEAKCPYRDNASVLLFAYLGLTEYIRWKEGINVDFVEDNEANFLRNKLAEGSGDRSLRAVADAALEYFYQVQERPGVWDIFIVKMVEIYEYYNEHINARLLLEKYRKANPTNLNAHRYLYQYYLRNHGPKEEKISCLESIVKLDPCNPLAIELFKEQESLDPQAMAILFDYLDFDHCRDNSQVWSFLQTALTNIYNDKIEYEEELQVVKLCWQTRRDWWPAHILHNDSVGSRELRDCKVAIQKLLDRMDSVV